MHQEKKKKRKVPLKPSVKCIRNLKLRIMGFFFPPGKLVYRRKKKKSIQIISFSPKYKITEVKVSLLLLFFLMFLTPACGVLGRSQLPEL